MLKRAAFLSHDPISGPVPRKKFDELVAKPFGEAKKIIRKYDPLHGREPGEKFNWMVSVESTLQGYAIVKAASEEEAGELADKLKHSDIRWDSSSYSDDFEILSVEPNGDD